MKLKVVQKLQWNLTMNYLLPELMIWLIELELIWLLSYESRLLQSLLLMSMVETLLRNITKRKSKICKPSLGSLSWNSSLKSEKVMKRLFVIRKSPIGKLDIHTSMLEIAVDLLSHPLLIDATSPLLRLWILQWEELLQVLLEQVRLRLQKILVEH